MPPRFGDRLSDSRFDFDNLTQYSEAREPPTSGHKSILVSHMFVNGSNHPYGCIQQYQSEGHWNNTPQTPNI